MTLYFETSWAILSTIGIANVLFGLTIVGITHGSPATAIPIVCSAAGAVANGLCYYAFYCDFPTANVAVASAVADLMWMVQEAGISFYSYAILVRVLRNRDATIFKSLFWALVLIIFAVRVLIVVTRVRAIVTGDLEFQYTLNRLHVGYFISIACLECVSAYFLLRKFASAKKLSMEASLGTGLFRYLMRSTEIRLAALALIGITRAVTYFFQPSLQVATNTASQFDRFVYTFECLFPVVI
ncbi:hypothetical protein GQ53DRAFT_632965 [Thozetella sp. PMI_491]|nr:hypothetical protein GQ53DRAFT_632965 [Thozetella sp. PMI_491]